MTETVLEKQKTKTRKGLIITLSAVATVIIAAVCVILFAKPDIKLAESNRISVEAGEKFVYPECKAKFLCFNLNGRLKKENNVDTNKLGEYEIKYTLAFLGKKYEKTVNVTVCDTLPPVITFANGADITVSSPKLYTDDGTIAYDAFDGDVTDTLSFEVIADADNSRVVYKASDRSGNTATKERKIFVSDTVPPVIKLTGGNEITVNIPHYKEKGYVATDDADGDITSAVVCTTDFVDGKEGTFTYNYTVKDSSGNTATATRKVHVKDTVAPVITVNGAKSMYLKIGESYSESGAYAIDAFEGDCTGKITVNGAPDTSKGGEYTVEYSVSDSKNNSAKVYRKVTVYDPSLASSGFIRGNGTVSNSTVYLTFDDGPSTNITPKVLDILAQNGVKATFFIVNYSNANKSLIARMIAEGHTVGIHGYTHDFQTAYSSADAYINNIDTLRQKLINDFGYNTNIIRFLGGSSNTVSKNYCVGIMKTLCPLVESLGYSYFDWNVSSGDAAGGTVPSATILANVKSGLKKGRGNVVLMHDINSKSTTANALQSIIDYCNANGYTFAGLSSDSPTAHHNVQN